MVCHGHTDWQNVPSSQRLTCSLRIRDRFICLNDVVPLVQNQISKPRRLSAVESLQRVSALCSRVVHKPRAIEGLEKNVAID